MISEQIVQELAEQLFTCFESGSAIAPITEAYPTLTIEEAYAIQRVLLTHHLAKGRRVVGRKIGATSKEVQRWVGVDQPDYGVLFDAFTFICTGGAKGPTKNIAAGGGTGGRPRRRLSHTSSTRREAGTTRV